MRAGTKADWLARSALVLLVLVLFREALAGGVLFRRDIHLIWHPQIEGFVHAVAGGSLPLWDPSPAFGASLLADPQAQVLYPLTWLNLVLRPWVYCTLYAVGHLLFSTLCFFALARRWGLSRLAAAAGAALWTLSGPLLSAVDLWHHFAGASFMPAVFLAAESAFETRRTRDVVLLGVVFGLQVLAGSADMCALTLLALLVWVAVVRMPWRDWRSSLQLLARGSAALLLAAAISAGAWVAAFDAVSRSSRHDLPEAVRTYWSVHPVALAELVLAGVPGRLPLLPAWRQALYEGREPFLASLYLGLPCLALVGAAFAAPGSRRRWALATLGLGAALAALGRHAPFYDLAIALVPPLRVLRYPVKAMVVVAFAWAGLAGFGVDVWRARAGARAEAAGSGRRWLTTVLIPLTLATAGAAAIATFVLAGLAAPSWMASLLAPPGSGTLFPLARGLAIHAALGALAVLLTLLRFARRASFLAATAAIVAVFDLAVAHPRPNPVAPAALYQNRPEVLGVLGDLRAARIYSYDYADVARPKDVPGPEVVQKLVRWPAGWSAEAALALAQQTSLAPQTAGRWRLRQAFDVDYKGLQPEPLAYLTRLVRLREQRPEELVRLLRLCSVTHVVAQHRVGGDRLRLVAQVPGFFAAPTLVLAVPDPMPRARVVAGVRIADGFDALGALLEPDFDPARMVLLPAGHAIEPPSSFRGSARIVDERADRVRIEAELSSEGYVVLADTHDPGWRVRVDGRPAPLVRANVAQRAVLVPAGRHVVEMSYRPPLVLAAVVVSIVSFLAALVALVLLA
jgi:hypothetical protein